MNERPSPVSLSARARRTLGPCMVMACIMVLLAGCVSAGLTGHSPFVQINALRLDGQSLELDLGVRNPNSVPILVEHVAFSVDLEGTPLAVHKAAADVSVLANGMENLRFQLTASAEGAALLRELESGERASLAYQLEGTITAAEQSRLKLDRRGRLYPVPGRPGQFR